MEPPPGARARNPDASRPPGCDTGSHRHGPSGTGAAPRHPRRADWPSPRHPHGGPTATLARHRRASGRPTHRKALPPHGPALPCPAPTRTQTNVRAVPEHPTSPPSGPTTLHPGPPPGEGQHPQRGEATFWSQDGGGRRGKGSARAAIGPGRAGEGRRRRRGGAARAQERRPAGVVGVVGHQPREGEISRHDRAAGETTAGSHHPHTWGRPRDAQDAGRPQPTLGGSSHTPAPPAAGTRAQQANPPFQRVAPSTRSLVRLRLVCPSTTTTQLRLARPQASRPGETLPSEAARPVAHAPPPVAASRDRNRWGGSSRRGDWWGGPKSGWTAFPLPPRHAPGRPSPRTRARARTAPRQTPGPARRNPPPTRRGEARATAGQEQHSAQSDGALPTRRGSRSPWRVTARSGWRSGGWGVRCPQGSPLRSLEKAFSPRAHRPPPSVPRSGLRKPADVYASARLGRRGLR